MSIPVTPLCEYLVAHEEWLMQRVLDYAHERNYTKYTSTLVEAWRISIVGLTEAISKAAELYGEIPELGPDDDFVADPIASFGILEAQKHRERGVTLSMFMGLLKYYRQTYVDCLLESDFDQGTKDYYRLFVDRCMDRVEMGFSQEWANVTGGEKLSELQTSNRLITNEKNKYLTIFESLHDPAIVLNTEHRIENVNHAGLALLGGAEAASGAIYYRDKRPEDLLPELASQLSDIDFTSRDEATFERSLFHAGERLHFDVKLKRMLDVSNKFAGTVLLLNDTTERKRAEAALVSLAEELERSNKELEQFAYVVSHDLQEPLRKITAFGDRLLRSSSDALDESGRDSLDRMINAANRMKGLIQSLLAYARVATRAKAFERVDLAQVAADVLSDLEVRIEETGGRVDVGELPMLHAEPVQMRQLLQNLIGNALKFSRPEEAPVVTISSEVLDEQTLKRRCRITISDNGIGFDMKYKDRIFGVFQRLHARGAYEGSGIGLAICSRIVSRHHGSLDVSSAEGKGTTFTIEIPCPKPRA
jgi:PAS domain S-box-containing protein